MGDALSSSDLFTSICYEDELACSLLSKASETSKDSKKKPALWLSLQTYSKVYASKLGLEAKQTAWYSRLVGGKKAPTVAVVPLTGQIFGGDGKSNSPREYHLNTRLASTHLERPMCRRTQRTCQSPSPCAQNRTEVG